MEKCPHCGSVLDVVGNVDGHDVFECPNECGKYEGAMTEEDIVAHHKAMIPQKPKPIRTTNCWNCGAFVERTLENQDDPYGHFCSKCGKSLRYHPYYGEGRPGDSAKRQLTNSGEDSFDPNSVILEPETVPPEWDIPDYYLYSTEDFIIEPSDELN